MVFDPYQIHPSGKWHVKAGGRVYDFDTREEAEAWAANRRKADRDRRA